MALRTPLSRERIIDAALDLFAACRKTHAAARIVATGG